jgi:hypothetical protein
MDANFFGDKNKKWKKFNGWNIQMMDEKIFRWIEIGKNINMFGLVPNLSHKFKNILKWKNKWEVWIGPPKLPCFGPPLSFTNLPTCWT